MPNFANFGFHESFFYFPLSSMCLYNKEEITDLHKTVEIKGAQINNEKESRENTLKIRQTSHLGNTFEVLRLFCSISDP